MINKLVNKHQPVLLEEIKTFIPKEVKFLKSLSPSGNQGGIECEEIWEA